MTVTAETFETKWQRQKREEFASVVEFREMIRAVGEHLPGRWRYDMSSNTHRNKQVDLLGPIEGVRLHFRVEYGKSNVGKVKISGGFPNEWLRSGLHVNFSSVGVSLSRGPDKIAAEIVRRLLADYLAEFEKVAEAYAKMKRVEEANDAAGKRIAAALHDEHKQRHWRKGDGHSSTGWEGQGFTHRVVIESGPNHRPSDERKEFEILCTFTVDDLTIDQALEMAEQFKVKGYVPPEPEKCCDDCGEKLSECYCNACEGCGLRTADCDCATAPSVYEEDEARCSDHGARQCSQCKEKSDGKA